MSTNSLTKAAAARRRAANPYSLGSALKNGDAMVWLSCLIMGFGNMMAGQIIKGLLFLAIEAAVIVYMVLPQGGIYWLSMLPSLGDRVDAEVWNDDKGVYEYLLSGKTKEKALSIRAFTENEKRTMYERQKGICPMCKAQASWVTIT